MAGWFPSDSGWEDKTFDQAFGVKTPNDTGPVADLGPTHEDTSGSIEQEAAVAYDPYRAEDLQDEAERAATGRQSLFTPTATHGPDLSEAVSVGGKESNVSPNPVEVKKDEIVHKANKTVETVMATVTNKPNNDPEAEDSGREVDTTSPGGKGIGIVTTVVILAGIIYGLSEVF